MTALYHGVELLSTKIEKRVDKKETTEYDDGVDKKTTRKEDRMTNTVRLNELIKESGLKKGWIADRLHLSSYGFRRKLWNKSQFKAGEIIVLCELLGIASLEEISDIFFNDCVDKKTTVNRKEVELNCDI
ncbi:hypothetical protein BXY41_104450 [Lacrimispora xylanisolvens]|uniref:Cro/C1-type helix-turn-helix DNA-binding protein n=1 Tax=Lacrimispora xylanisolvens TaxID=384636 RepID=A0A2S6HV01_9FIRM|nr:hypothetical protein [Hungatella xylanolytica]PPK81647.1 hypothetical protein BXY41_104450 [Hungatella xylanolytica]